MQRDWQVTRKIVDSKVPADEKALYEAKANEEDGYVEFYEQRQDKIIEKDPDAFAKTNRVWQFEYLRDRDLPRDATFLDYGCGPVAAGVYFIEYLDAGKYVGVDISKKSIDVGEELIRARGLDAKKPRLLYTPKGDMGTAGQRAVRHHLGAIGLHASAAGRHRENPAPAASAHACRARGFTPPSRGSRAASSSSSFTTGTRTLRSMRPWRPAPGWPSP